MPTSSREPSGEALEAAPQEVLRSSDQYFRLIVDSIPGLIFTTTAQGVLEHVNRQLLQYFGKTLEELKNWAMTDTVHPDDLPRVVATWTCSVESGEPYDLEERLRRADGVYRWFYCRILPIRDSDGHVIRWYGLLTDIDERKRAERRLRRAIKARYEAALGERTRIAQELHDTLLQGFTGITFKLRAIQRRLLERPTESSADLEDVLAQAETALADARHMIWDMRSAELEGRDLAAALEAAARQAVAGSSVGLVFNVSGERRRLPLEVETAAIRMGREAVANALKHAAAGTLEVQIEYNPRSLLLKVVDDGRGISPGSVEAATARGHWGIAGMKARAEGTRGTLDITSVPGRGTTVSISLPTS